MQFRVPAIALAATTCLTASTLLAQAVPTGSDIAIFGIAHRAIDSKLPAGRRLIAADDPLLRVPPGSENDVGLANRQLANAVGLPTAALKDVLTCRTSYDCYFKGGIVATVSLRMSSRTADSAVVEVATRYFLTPSTKRPGSTTFARQAVALYEVILARRVGQWIVVSVTPRMES